VSVDPFEPVPVDDNAPALAPGQEWVIPAGRPLDRLVVLAVPDDAPALVREGLARRRIQAVEGTCPCDGRLIWMDDPDHTLTRGLQERGAFRTSDVVAVHRTECPAHDSVLVPALAAWHAERDSG
jgi:hypothetical protein